MKIWLCSGIVIVATIALAAPVFAPFAENNTVTGGQPVGVELVPLTTVVANDQPISITVQQSVPNPHNLTKPIPYSLFNLMQVRLGITDIFFVTIPGGVFQMGDIQNYNKFSHEKPVHEVSIRSFEMSIYEVTQEQYQSVTGTNPAYFSETYHPVEQVSWYDAVKFCNALSDTTDFERCYNERTWECDFTKNGFRLPTEAEWEYACRAGTETYFYNGKDLNEDGNTSTDLGSVGWYYGNSGYQTHPAGEKVPNAWGLYDMHGNVWEWCNDWFGSGYYNSPSSKSSNDPPGPASGFERVIRGGCWRNHAWHCRSAYRYMDDPSKSYNLLGFRIVRRP